MKKTQTLLSILIFLFLFSCQKDKDESNKKDQIIGMWTFIDKPTQNLNNYQGYIEDRTVFQGNEILTFKSNGNFFIDSINYGDWKLDSTQTNIQIELTYNNGYPPDGFAENSMIFELINLNDSVMEVYHRYYKYYDNKYKLRKK